ncbi:MULTISPECIES: hypothetical protein [Oligella]|uniref:Uncharacterized protein n=1 Tax=Oligella urethralis TaxID=90245 RepID=A0A2X1UWF6_9BURK|nr:MULTISPECIES: hypothetical protein [Oligella]SPY08053.1 Uncharacterised protein [Oligella urethralis]
MKISAKEYRLYKQFYFGNGKYKPQSYGQIKERVMYFIDTPTPRGLAEWPTLGQINRGF